MYAFRSEMENNQAEKCLCGLKRDKKIWITLQWKNLWQNWYELEYNETITIIISFWFSGFFFYSFVFLFLKDESTEIADPLLAPIPSSSEIFGISLISVSSRSGKRDVSLMDFFLMKDVLTS